MNAQVFQALGEMANLFPISTYQVRVPVMDLDSESQRLYTLKDVAEHNKDGDLWVVINGKVFDLTTYMDTHPGGKQVILKHGGMDATKKFQKYHKPQTMARYGDELCIGTVQKTGSQGKRIWDRVLSKVFDRA